MTGASYIRMLQESVAANNLRLAYGGGWNNPDREFLKAQNEELEREIKNAKKS